MLHIDLHETTDSDESEFRPALAARDGKPFEPGLIPDGFYLVDDSEAPQPAFQQAVIAAVEKVTHIAPADDKGEIIGSPVIAHGVIEYPLVKLGLCAGITGAKYHHHRGTRTARGQPAAVQRRTGGSGVRGTGLRARPSLTDGDGGSRLCPSTAGAQTT